MTYRPDPKNFFKPSELTMGFPQTPVSKNGNSFCSESDLPRQYQLTGRKLFPLSQLKPLNYKNKMLQKHKLLQNFDFNISGLSTNNCFLDKNFLLSNLSNMNNKRLNTYKPLYSKHDNNNLSFIPNNKRKISNNTNEIKKINFPKILSRNVDNKNLYLRQNDNNKNDTDMFTNIENNIQNKSTKLIVNDVKILKKENLSERDFENIHSNFFINTQIKTDSNKNNENKLFNKNELKKIIEKDQITLYEKHKKLIDKKKIYDYNSHWNGNVINLKDDKQYKKIKKFEIMVNKIKNSKTGYIVDASY